MNKINSNIYVLCGGARTFLECFDSCYTNVISKLFNNNKNNETHILFYLKLTDPGPKGQKKWNFTYKDNNETDILNKINELKRKCPRIKIYIKIIKNNEIDDNELLSQVKNRKKYIGFLSENKKLLRALHFCYNLERCGQIIKEIENENEINFNYYVFIRPDLYFTEQCENINKYNNQIITLGEGPNNFNNDHLAIIPKEHFDNFFFDRMKLIRNNDDKCFSTSEKIYWETINYEVKKIGKYFICRN